MLFLFVMLLALDTFAQEPDERGIGGTGHSDVDLDILDQLEMPERVEMPEGVDMLDLHNMMEMDEATNAQDAGGQEPTPTGN